MTTLKALTFVEGRGNLDPVDGICLYTDGSAWAKDGSGGWAYVALDAFGNSTTGYGREVKTTNNRMEMAAAAQGLSWMFSKYGACEVLVRCDSEYVVKGITQPGRARVANLDYWQFLQRAVDLHAYVEWEHVRGHATDRFNNLADKLAGEARRGLL